MRYQKALHRIYNTAKTHLVKRTTLLRKLKWRAFLFNQTNRFIEMKNIFFALNI